MDVTFPHCNWLYQNSDPLSPDGEKGSTTLSQPYQHNDATPLLTSLNKRVKSNMHPFTILQWVQFALCQVHSKKIYKCIQQQFSCSWSSIILSNADMHTDPHSHRIRSGLFITIFGSFNAVTFSITITH